jgi:small GTP-binding protein
MADWTKVLLSGANKTGKTALHNTYVSGKFPADYVECQADNYTLNTTVGNQSLTVSLWDDSGSIEYERLRPLSYPQTNVFIMMFAVHKPQTLYWITDVLYLEILHHCRGTKATMWIVATMIDKRKKHPNSITTARGEAIAKCLGVNYAELCIRDVDSVKQFFDSVLLKHLACTTPLDYSKSLNKLESVIDVCD